MGAVDWADRGGLACILQPRLLLVVGGEDLGIFAHLLSLYRFSGVGATDFLLAFLGGSFPLIGWDGVDGVFCLFFFSFFSLSLARQRGNAARAKLG